MDKPTVGEMTKNLAKVAKDTAKRKIAGKKATVSQDERQRRWNICTQCAFLTAKNRCKKCGCFMKAKVTLVAAGCPIGKWKIHSAQQKQKAST